MKRIIAVLLAALMVLPALAVLAESGHSITIEEFKQVFLEQNLQVDDEHGVTAEGVTGGFLVHMPGVEGEGTWLLPVVAFESEEAAYAYAKMMYDSGIATVLNGNIVTTINEEPDIPAGAEEAGEAVPEATVGSLAEIRQAADDAGYEIIELLDVQKAFIPGVVDGFNIELDGTGVSILEFADAATLGSYKADADASDINGAIVNGLYCALYDVEDGVPNQIQVDALEQIMGLK